MDDEKRLWWQAMATIDERTAERDALAAKLEEARAVLRIVERECGSVWAHDGWAAACPICDGLVRPYGLVAHADDCALAAALR